MEIEQVKLSQVKANAENPRQIGKVKFQKLIDSLLVFPAMLEIRPVVIDNQMVALGGNQRLAALRTIGKMDDDELARRIYSTPEYQERTEAEKRQLVSFWSEWRLHPMVYVIRACTLTAAERRQFIIKDNVSFGQWDFDALANKWDSDRLEAMGLDVWTTTPAEFAPAERAGAGSCAPGDCGADDDPAGAVEGSGQRAGRIVITYAPDDRPVLAGLLGVDPATLFSRGRWAVDELEDMRRNMCDNAGF